MRETHVRKGELLAHLRENRRRHSEALVEGERLYRERVTERLQEMLLAASAGEEVPAFHGIERPTDHTADYEDAITLIGFDVREEIPLDEREARRYVLDQWEWRASFYGTLRGLGYVGDQGEYPDMQRA